MIFHSKPPTRSIPTALDPIALRKLSNRYRLENPIQTASWLIGRVMIGSVMIGRVMIGRVMLRMDWFRMSVGGGFGDTSKERQVV